MLGWDATITPPTSLKHGKTPFDDRAYTTKWVAQLPLAASGRAAADIYAALAEVAEHALAYKKRLYLLEQTAQIIAAISQGLTQEIYQGGLPLKDDTAEKTKLLLGILGFKVIGYQQVIAELTASAFAGGLWRRQRVGTSMLRILELLGQMLELYRVASVPSAPGVWQLFNRYYAIAEADRQVDVPRKGISGERKLTIATVFKSQVLLDSLNYYDLHPFELEQARILLATLTQYVSITKSYDVANANHFCFRIDGDAPPSRFAPTRKCQCEASDMRRVFDLGALMAELEKMAKLPELMTLASTQSAQAAHLLIARKLLEGWRVIGGEREARTERGQMIRAIHKLSTIAAVLAQGGLLQSLAATADGLAETDEHARGEDESLRVPPYVVAGHGGWREDFRKGVEAELLDARLDNESSGGFGISFPMAVNGDVPRYKTGELFALETDGSWVLASVRWVRVGAEQVSMGLSRLGSEIQPHSMVLYRNDAESQPLPVLLIRDSRNEPAIVLHNLSSHQEQQVGIPGSENLPLDLLLESTPSYACYRISEAAYQHIYQRQVTEAPEVELEALMLQFLQQKAAKNDSGEEMMLPAAEFDRIAERDTDRNPE